MNEPQDTAIEELKSEAPESADSDLSDEALDRPLREAELSTIPMCPYIDLAIR